MKEILKLGLILFLISVIAAVGLAFTNEMTETTIADQKAVKNEEARKAVLPSATSFELVELNGVDTVTSASGAIVTLVEAYKGLDGDTVVGYVIKTLPQGYGGGVEVITGVDATGAVTGVRVGKHTETPGLGANATLPSYYDQYSGKEAAYIKVSKTQSSDTEVQAIAGATITSVAVTEGVNASGELAMSLMGK